MVLRSCAIVLRPRDPPTARILTAELRLAGLLREVAALEEEVAGLARELAAFESRYVGATGRAFAELDAAEQLARRVRRVVDEVERLDHALRREPPAPGAHGEVRGEVRARAAAGAARTARRSSAARPAPSPLAALDLKALHRRLARLLHPDLARGSEAERARRSDLMARVNEAYERGDRAELELLAERAGALRCDDSAPEADRLFHLASRIASVEGARARLVAEQARLSGSPSAQLRAEAPRRAASGGDLLAETRAAAEAEARAHHAVALELLARLGPGLSRLGRARREWLALHGRARDPVATSPLVRRGPTRGGRGQAAARRLALALERRARTAPWEAALTLLAFLGEAAGRTPEALTSWELLADRWGALRAGWSGAPDLAGALSRLPLHLEFGLRLCGDEVEGGLQLASPELADGVRAALERDAVRELAQRVIAALGPLVRCECAGDVYAVHLLRLRGLDEVHGLACPRCARILRSFWRYGEPRGLEALWPLAVEVGLVVEQPVHLAGELLAFQMLPAERNRLTARALLRRFREVCLAPYGVDLPRGSLALRAGRRLLADGERVPEAHRVTVVVRSGTLRDRDLLALLQEKVNGRFRA